MECLPDVPELCRDTKVFKQNQNRLKFYEQFNVFPIANTKYETPIKEGGDCPPYLMFDSLGSEKPLSKKLAQKIVRAFLSRKYYSTCPDDYLEMVVESFRDDPVQLWAVKYNSRSLGNNAKSFFIGLNSAK